MKLGWRFVTLVLLSLFFIGCAGQSTPTPQTPSKQEVAKLTSPGDGHAVLANFVGKWQHTVRWWLSPEAEAAMSTGSNLNEWILGGRFIRQMVNGNAMGQPFEGLGITGFDNVRGEYTSVWMDSLGTGMMSAKGHFDADRKSIIETGEFSDPMTGESARPFRGLWTVRDASHYTYEMFVKRSDGEEFRAMQINYTRVKK